MACLIDTHCHLDYISTWEGKPEGVSRAVQDVIARAKAVGVQRFINPTVDLENIPKVLALAEAHEEVFPAVAIHPTDTMSLKDRPDWEEELLAAINHPKVVAIGETGLDYYHCDAPEVKAFQQTCFAWFLQQANDRQLPVIIHDREAHEDVLAMVKDFPGVTGIMHCFSGDAAFAAEMVEQGFYISFAGNVTFKNAQPLRDAAQAVPLERLLIETDAPFLTPVPHRGEVNEPAHVQYVFQQLASVYEVPVETLQVKLWESVKALFPLMPLPKEAYISAEKL